MVWKRRYDTVKIVPGVAGRLEHQVRIEIALGGEEEVVEMVLEEIVLRSSETLLIPHPHPTRHTTERRFASDRAVLPPHQRPWRCPHAR